jgi:hypothetical protein
MSQPENSNKPTENLTSEPGQPSQPEKKNAPSSIRTASIIGLALVAILALSFAGYTALNPHVTTVTEQQLFTNTQSFYSTETQTVTTVSQVAQVVTVINPQATTAVGVGQQPGYYQYCSPYGCMYAPGPSYNTYNPYNPPNPWSPGYYNGAYYGYWNGNFYPPCQTSGYTNNVTCTGYLFQAQNGCTVLVIPIANAFYSETYTFQYYTLHNLPSNAPSNGSWITVSGQLYQGANTSSLTGASCPGNYINVTSIS